MSARPEEEGLLSGAQRSDANTSGAPIRASPSASASASAPRAQRRRGDDPNDADCCSHHETFWTAIAFIFIVIILVGLMAGAYWKGRKDNKQYALPLLLLSVLPSFVIMGFMYLWKARRSVPAPMVATMYIFGILGAMPLALLESFVSGLLFPAHDPKLGLAPPKPLWLGMLNATLLAFVIAAASEEGFKYIMTYCRAAGASPYCTEYGIMILALSCALGFATLENADYVLSGQTTIDQTLLVALSRGVLSVPLHAVCGILIGERVAWALRTKGAAAGACGGCGVFTQTFVPAWMIHGWYDWWLMAPEAFDPPNKVGF